MPPTPPAANGKTRILIVDDHPIVRQGLVQLINREPDLQIGGESENGPKAISLLERDVCDMAIVDLSLTGGNGIELVKSLLAHWPKLPILILSMHDEAIYAERALRAGAKGYVMKQEPAEKLLDAIRCVASGGIFLSERMNARVLHQFIRGKPSENQTVIDRLSDRELEVLMLLGNGRGTRQIAEQLNLSVKTVESHRAHLKEKLEIEHAPELVRFAVEWVRSQEPV